MEKIMGEIMQEHVDRLMMLGTLSADEFTELLRYRNAETTEYLFQKAEEVRKQQFDKEVYLWGRLPFSNYCKNDCNYCGLRRSNRFVKRYRMNMKEIVTKVIGREFAIFCWKVGQIFIFRRQILQKLWMRYISISQTVRSY